MRKRMIEISKGVFRDPDLVVMKASDGEWKRYGEEDQMK